MILLIFFGTLALLAVWATRGDEDLRWIGVCLFIGYALSNALHATMPVSAMPGPYSLIEILVLLATSIAWDAHRNCWPLFRIRGVEIMRCWPLLVLGGVNILSICINIAFASLSPATLRQIFVFELTTNICFMVECLLATGAGVANGLRIGRFRRLSGLWIRIVAPNAGRTKNGHG